MISARMVLGEWKKQQHTVTAHSLAIGAIAVRVGGEEATYTGYGKLIYMGSLG
jgi:hypothetical protein